MTSRSRRLSEAQRSRGGRAQQIAARGLPIAVESFNGGIDEARNGCWNILVICVDLIEKEVFMRAPSNEKI